MQTLELGRYRFLGFQVINYVAWYYNNGQIPYVCPNIAFKVCICYDDQNLEHLKHQIATQDTKQGHSLVGKTKIIQPLGKMIR